jgi:hypothetical protein
MLTTSCELSIDCDLTKAKKSYLKIFFFFKILKNNYSSEELRVSNKFYPL